MIKAGLSLLFLVLFGIPFLFLFISFAITYPIFWLIIPFVLFMSLGVASGNHGTDR